MDIPNEKCNYRTINYLPYHQVGKKYILRADATEHQKNVNPLVPPEDRYGADE